MKQNKPTEARGKLNHPDEVIAREELVIDNEWQVLKKYTQARIGLGRAGISQSTKDHLDFQLAHAYAQDAVKTPLDWLKLEQSFVKFNIPILTLHSKAKNRDSYLQRPDLGRRLDLESLEKLKAWQVDQDSPIDVCLVIADGLSTKAIEMQSGNMIKNTLQNLEHAGFSCPLICFVKQARVAIGDEVAECLNAKMVVVMIGERPGLSSPNSLGVYFTYQPRIGFSDAQRNCLSNIRAEGLSYNEACHRLIWLIKQASIKQLSGVKMKDESPSIEQIYTQKNNLN
ncbi:MAG: ethanolamine ammonia-lyase small subunit [Oleiphilaceae bacterium]|jgi:ethanolamine ammonia-lyase small subunit